MNFTNKKIEKVLVSILGEEAASLINNLIGKENVSEFDLAKRTKQDIKIVRKTLYILYNYNLIKFNRKKDKEKGWYIYYWTLIPENIHFDYYKRKRNLLEKLKMRLEEEEKELFFICPNKCIRLTFDQAMDFEFHCPECGELINQDESKEEVKLIQKKVIAIEKELEELKAKRMIRRKKLKEKKKEVEKKKKVVIKQKPVKKKTVAKKKTHSKKEKTTKTRVIKKKVVKKKTAKKKAIAKKKISKKKTLKKIPKTTVQKKIKKTNKK